MKNIAIFASGSGTNAENIIRHFYKSNVAQIRLVLTENPLAFVLSRAKKLGVPSKVISLDDIKGGVVATLLREEGIDFIVLAGFLKLIPKNIIDLYPNKIINIHPALLPKHGGKGMYGMNVHKAVLNANDTESGITIHYVNSNYDDGDIIFQAKCPVISCDQPETLSERVHSLEYEHYPVVIERLLKD